MIKDPPTQSTITLLEITIHRMLQAFCDALNHVILRTLNIYIAKCLPCSYLMFFTTNSMQYFRILTNSRHFIQYLKQSNSVSIALQSQLFKIH